MEVKKRPTLADPVEFALVKSIYFPKDRLYGEDVDQEERYDRIKHNHKTNQAR